MIRTMKLAYGVCTPSLYEKYLHAKLNSVVLHQTEGGLLNIGTFTFMLDCVGYFIDSIFIYLRDFIL